MDRYDGIMLMPRSGILSLTGTQFAYAMATQNTGWAMRFIALDTRDVYAVYVYFQSVTTPGSFTLTIETDSSGLPSGTLYNSNATATFTPVQGWNPVIFSPSPTSGLTAGNAYYVVLINTTGGTTATLGSHNIATSTPVTALQAANGTTRTNFANVGGSMPIAAFKMSDTTYASLGALSAASANLSKVYGTNALGFSFQVPTGATWKVRGFTIEYALKLSTAFGVKCSIFSGTTATPVATITYSATSLVSLSTHGLRAIFGAPVTLSSGTYRAILEDASHAGASSDALEFYSAIYYDSSLAAQGLTLAGTSNITASPITWDQDNTAYTPLMGLILDDMPAISSSGGTSITYG